MESWIGDVVVSSDTRLVCVAPPGTQGESVTVTLTTKNGQVSRMEAFTYDGIRPELTTIVPDHGPATGGTRVTLSGHDFLAAGAGLTAVMVPLFITNGEKIKVDTRDGRYLGRA